MKKYIWLLLPIFTLIIYYLITHVLNFENINKAVPMQNSEITKIEFVDGRGGLNKPLTVTEPQKINEFMSYLNKLVIIELKNPKPSTGWVYNALLYSNDKKIASITFGNPIIINQNSYYVIFNNLSTKTITNYLRSVDSSWRSE